MYDSITSVNFVGSFMDSLNTYYVPDPILSTESMAVDKTEKISTFPELTF